MSGAKAKRIAQAQKDSRQWALGSKCGTADYRAPEKQKILNRRFTQISADEQRAKGNRPQTTDYRTTKKEKIPRVLREPPFDRLRVVSLVEPQREPSSERYINRRFTPINADN